MLQVSLILKVFCLVRGLPSLPSPEKNRETGTLFYRYFTANYGQIIASGALTRENPGSPIQRSQDLSPYVSNII